jgi:hypothetical protein
VECKKKDEVMVKSEKEWKKGGRVKFSIALYISNSGF